jgi:hypothetical protein
LSAGCWPAACAEAGGWVADSACGSAGVAAWAEEDDAALLDSCAGALDEEAVASELGAASAGDAC